MSGLLPFGKRQSVAIGAVLCAVSAMVPVVWGDGVTPSEVDLLDGVAWLSNDANGDVVRVNGETGQVDARVGLNGPLGTIDIEQAGSSVLVRVGGEVRSIDVSELDWGATAPSATGMVVAESIAYLVDLDGQVRALNPSTLEVEAEMSLDAAPVSTTLSGDRLVAALDDGSVKVVDRDEVVADVDMGASGDRLAVTALGDQVAALNLSQDELRRINPETGRARREVEVDLPAGEIEVPPELPRGRLWVSAERTGQLVGINARTGDTERTVVAEGRHELTAPVAMSGHVFLVDRTAATLVEVDATPLQVLRQEPLGIADASAVELIAEGNKIFVNDPNSELAIVIDGDQYRRVDKYSDEGVAEAPSDLPAPPGEAPADDGAPAPAPAPAPGPEQPPLAPPATPVQVQAVAGNESASVSWSHGAGGGAPGAYHVTWDGGRTIDVPGSQLSVDVGGLQNGQRYVFEVWASNDLGDSGRARSNAVEPSDDIPGRPGNVRAESADAGARVSWSEADGRGNDIASYVVTASPGGRTHEVRGNQTSADVGGLTNGERYTFTVTAVNDIGNQSEPSQPSNQVMPYGPPGEIPGVDVQVGDGSADLTWEAAANQSNTPVTYDISVTPAPGGGGSDSTQQTSHQITGLENGTSYSVTITPRNDRGSGPSTTTQVRPGKAPEVSGVSAERTNDRQFRINYDVDNGGRSVTNCTVTASNSGGSTGCDASASSVTVSVPQYSTEYTFTVSVTTELGEGTGSATGSSDGKQLTVDASATRWDGATCSWPGHENQRPLLARTTTCEGFVGWVPNNATVRASCWASGDQYQDDQEIQSTRYVRATYNGTTGYMGVLYFDGFNNQDNIVEGLPRC